MKGSKGQAAVDFMVILAVALVLFLALFSLAEGKSNALEQKSAKLYATQVAESIAMELNAVFLAGDGANRTVQLPQTLDGAAYNLSIYGEHRRVVVEFDRGERQSSAAMLLTARVTGNLTNRHSAMKITNYGGGIVVE